VGHPVEAALNWLELGRPAYVEQLALASGGLRGSAHGDAGVEDVMSVRLSPEEAWEFLARSHTGILTTLRSDGMPIALPVWFVTLDRRVYVGTPSHTKKVARLERDPRVSFLAEAGERWAELCAVHLTGRARVVRETDLLQRVGALLEAKYRRYRTQRKAMPERTRAYYAVERTLIEIVPDERILSWDNSRLALRT
jgi:PPOX class probable F420-dependent enzyme